jgi:hypothetical protein
MYCFIYFNQFIFNVYLGNKIGINFRFKKLSLKSNLYYLLFLQILFCYFFIMWTSGVICSVCLDLSVWILDHTLYSVHLNAYIHAGRAGRYGSNFPLGEVTCMYGDDLPLLHSALDSPSPILQVT